MMADTSWDSVDKVPTLSRLTERQRKTVGMLRAEYAKVPEYDVVATLDMNHISGVFSKEPNLKVILSERMVIPGWG